MSGRRTAALVVLGLLLAPTLAAGNTVFAAHATVLDPGFVTTALEEDGGYEALTEAAEGVVRNATSDADRTALERSSFASLIETDPILAAVTPSYVESGTEPNVRALYAYLHGRTDRLNLTLETESIAERAGESVAGSIRNATVPELVAAAPDDPFADVPVEEGFVERLDADHESYRSAKASLREDVHDRVLEAAVSQEFNGSDEDRLLGLVVEDYDPQEHSEAEKERMVEDREGEIRDALGSRIESERGDDIDARAEDRIDEFRRDAADRRPSPDAVGNEAIADAAGDVKMAVVTAATTDRSYDAYRANVTSARDELPIAVGGYVQGEVTAAAADVDLNEQLNVSERGAFETPRSITGYADLGAILLPLLAVLLVAGVWYASGSVAATAATVGASLVAASIPGIVGAPLAGSRLRAMMTVEGDAASSLAPVIEGIVGRVVGTYASQAAVLAVLGLLLVGVALALRYDVDERVRQRWDR